MISWGMFPSGVTGIPGQTCWIAATAWRESTQSSMKLGRMSNNWLYISQKPEKMIVKKKRRGSNRPRMLASSTLRAPSLPKPSPLCSGSLKVRRATKLKATVPAQMRKTDFQSIRRR